MSVGRTTTGVGLLIVFLFSPGAQAQQVDGPPPPDPPATIARDTEGRATIRAIRVATPLRIDGQLDESLYGSVLPVSDFIQVEPNDGTPATQKTELWVSFDQTNVYVTFRVWESQPDRMIVNEMRRDSTTKILQNETVAFILDTYYDRRNGVLFHINAIGGRWMARSPTNVSTTPTGTRSGTTRPDDSPVGGRSRPRSRSSRSATGPGVTRSGVSTPAASTGGRTRSRT